MGLDKFRALLQEDNGYVCFYNRTRVEVLASSTYAAQQKVAAMLHVPPKRHYQISVTLAQKDETPVVHTMTEDATVYTVPAMQQARYFNVDYYAETRTPKGSRSRFQRRVGIEQIRDARSETAVWSYLQRLHPGCDIQIQNLEWQ